MEQNLVPTTISPQARPESTKPKQAWRKPTITFVPLNTTAGGKGSPTDGNTGSQPG